MTELYNSTKSFKTCVGRIQPNGYCDSCGEKQQTSSAICGRLIETTMTKQKTAMQTLYEKVHSSMTHGELIDWLVENRVENLAKEREQIIAAYKEGHENTGINGDLIFEPDYFFDKTYEQ